MLSSHKLKNCKQKDLCLSESDEQELTLIENETNLLLQNVKKTSPIKRKRKKSNSLKNKVVGRVTIEVLDDVASTTASLQSSRLQIQDEKEEDLINEESNEHNISGKGVDTRVTASTSDFFNFKSEEVRVRQAKDTFVPSSTPEKRLLERQKCDLHNESTRQRLIHEQYLKAQELTKDQDAGKKNRVYLLKLARAAIKIQAVARGYFARTQVEKVKSLMKGAAQWQEVHDVKNNEKWYYNQITGESQWEPPEEIRVQTANMLMPSNRFPMLENSKALFDSTSKKPYKNDRPISNMSINIAPSTTESTSSTLPPLSPSSSIYSSCSSPRYTHSNTPSQSNNKHTELPSLSIKQNTKTIVPEGCASIDTDRSDDFDNDIEFGSNSDNDESFFLADGSKNNSKLRETIRDALKVSRFDSVSTVLASGFKFSKDKESKGKHTKSKSRQVVLGNISHKYMVSVVGSPNKTKSSSCVSKVSKKKANAAQSPQVRNIDDPGFQPNTDNNNEKSTEISQGTFADKISESPKKKKNKENEICFACWSACKGRKCEAHTSKWEQKPYTSDDENSSLMCSNWEADQLRRKYRAEEIQEIFMKQNSSLRYDKQRKQYITVIECRHPIYQNVNDITCRMNKTMRRKIHVRSWFRSFLEYLRSGKVPAAGKRAPSLIKLKNTTSNAKWCNNYTDSIKEFISVAPVTLRKYLNLHDKPRELDVILIDAGKPQQVNWVLLSDHTKPIELYRPRSYNAPSRRCVPMPTPSFIEDIPLPVPNVYIDACHIGSWFERLSARLSHSSIDKAVLQISACIPPKGTDLIRRTKITKILTVNFATFGRKVPPGKTSAMAVGGLFAELLSHMLVTTYVPPQFGNFTLMDRRAICPNPYKLDSFAYVKLEALTSKYVERPLEHSLNVRKVPTITVSTAAPKNDFHYHGKNRPEQTGEEISHGFRTTVHSGGLSLLSKTTSVTFVPSIDSVTANLPSINSSITTRADRFYPFCEPTTKENSVIEFLHLLWVGKATMNQGQCFTNLGIQDPGDFMKNSNPENDMGSCLSVVYRSWATMQSQLFEEFVTDEGIAYWYKRSTGETFWEPPVEKQDDQNVDDLSIISKTLGETQSEQASLGVGATKAKYSQNDMRKYMRKTIEEPEEKEKRIKDAKTSANIHNILPPQKQVATIERKIDSDKIKIPALNFKQNHLKDNDGTPEKAPKKVLHSPCLSNEPKTPAPKNVESDAVVNGIDTNSLMETIKEAFGKVLPSQASNQVADMNMLQFGLGLGMGLGIKAANEQNNRSCDENRITNSTPLDQVDNRGSSSANHISLCETTRSAATSITTCRSTISDQDGVTCHENPTPTPDESDIGKQVNDNIITNEYTTHKAAGIEDSSDSKIDFTKDEFNGALQKSVANLPKNFLEHFLSTKVVPMSASYLPKINNVNSPKCVGVIKPRAAAVDWMEMSFDPWSAGKELFSTEFFSSISFNDEEESGPSTAAGAEFIEAEGHSKRTQELNQSAKDLQDLEKLLSLCRHGKYTELENIIKHPDWALPVDAKDGTGNTLFSVACQNNNKRIAKLCMRRGADINTQNINGQTALHYCYEYNFTDLAEYLTEKGAKDDILNAEGLTCYEGLNLDKVDAI